MKIIFFTLPFILFMIGFAHAESAGGVFVEPMITYEKGTGNIHFPDPINSSNTNIDGFGVGARLGFHIFETIFLGLDGRYAMPQFKDSSLGQKTEAKAWNYGPVVGIQMPTTLALRVWAGYIFDGQLDPDKDKNVDEKFSDAHGYRIGAGIKLGIISLNLEYQALKYDTTDINEVGTFNPGYSTSNIHLDTSAWILSASFPIAI